MRWARTPASTTSSTRRRRMHRRGPVRPRRHAGGHRPRPRPRPQPSARGARMLPLPITYLRRFVSMGARGLIKRRLRARAEGRRLPRSAFRVPRAVRAEPLPRDMPFSRHERRAGVDRKPQYRLGHRHQQARALYVAACAALGLAARARSVVSGDTCARAKPHPDPLLHASRESASRRSGASTSVTTSATCRPVARLECECRCTVRLSRHRPAAGSVGWRRADRLSCRPPLLSLAERDRRLS